MSDTLFNHLSFLYGAETAQATLPKLQQLLAHYRQQLVVAQTAVSERDAILITYGDMVQVDSETPLSTLAAFLSATVKNGISTVHILPFYPYTSDDGFSVVDYKAVNPDLGDWEDVGKIGDHFRLMFDAVVNHISASSDWFQRFLADEPGYRDYFTVVDSSKDLTAVFRPRALPLLTPVETKAGTKHVWTTFSADQIDLNFASPDVLLEVIDVLLFYVANGAEFIRLDAIGFMWKEIGTSCIHLPKAHRAIQLMRSALDEIVPHVALITETNVPHKDNISYFGDGTNEAQMVYNFSLPPLTLHAFHTGNAEVLSQWAATLELPSDKTTFFNFLASHDGIGLMPTRGILPDDEVAAIAKRVEALGGFVSYKNNPDGSQSPYELNVNYLDGLGVPGEEETAVLRAKRFLTSQAIMLVLRGVPGIYFHSLFGSQGWLEGVAQTGRNRTINREKLQKATIEQELADPQSLRSLVLRPYLHMLQTRALQPAFHPNGQQEILAVETAVFAVLRRDQTGKNGVLCLQNVSDEAVEVELELEGVAGLKGLLVAGEVVRRENGRFSLTLEPYAVRWLELDSGSA
ncbi:MAG: sugar phosphorylase [Chloroflexota bacterium]